MSQFTPTNQYCGYNDLLAYIDAINLAACSNDFGTGAPVNIIVINNICAIASSKVDSMVSSVYNVPFQGNVPTKIYTAAVIFSVELLWARRLTPTESNPMKSEADYWRKELMLINAGELSLDAATARQFTPIVFRAVKSRMNSTIY